MKYLTRLRYADWFYYSCFPVIFLFSFFTFSYRFYPMLNSDMAINILMTPEYHLPDDLYAWGQDRGGSFIPLLSHIVYKIIHISPISAVSLVHYSILILGFLCASTLFQYRLSKVFLALIWFFPPWHFTDFVLFPFGTQASLMFIGIWFLNKMKKKPGMILQTIWLSLASLLLIISVWVSDLGLVSILILAPFILYEWIREAKEEKNRNGFRLKIVIIALWTIMGLIFILFGKAHASKIDIYIDQPFNTWSEINSALKIVFNSLYETFSFSTENPVEGIYAWMILLGIPVVKWLSIFRNKGWFHKTDRKWFLFFMFNGILLFMVMLLSHWVFMNDLGRRYFVLVYLFFGMVIMIMTETPNGLTRRYLNILLAVIVLTGSISSFYKFHIPEYSPPKVKTLSEFQSLGDIGLVAEYWNSYLSATPDPIRIKATPHDKDYVRNYKLVEEVFSQTKLFIIKDMWLTTFPDTIVQFGRTLTKKGDSLYLGGCWINQYEIVYPKRIKSE